MATILNSRRHLLVGAAGSLLLSAPALADQRRQATPKKKAAEAVPVTATEDLMREHGVLRRILLIYEAGARRIGQGEDIDPAVFSQAAETMRDFVHDYHEKRRRSRSSRASRRPAAWSSWSTSCWSSTPPGRKLTDRILRALAPKRGTKGERQAMIDAMQASITLYRPHVARERHRRASRPCAAWSRPTSSTSWRDAREGRDRQVRQGRLRQDGQEGRSAREAHRHRRPQPVHAEV